jgi:hypothetical protein
MRNAIRDCATYQRPKDTIAETEEVKVQNFAMPCEIATRMVWLINQ